MQPSEILSQVGDTINRVLSLSGVKIVEATTAQDVPNWDSLSNIEIILAVEQRFGVRFTSREIQSFRNVGHMCDTILKKTALSVK